MSQIYNILIINNFPITADAYSKTLLEKKLKNIFLNVSTAYNINNALTKINNVKYDLILIDTNLTKGESLKISSIESLKKIVKNKSSLTKIIITTSYNDNLRLINILSKLNPDGLLLKSDITKNDLQTATKTVIQGNPFYSNTINKLFRKRILQRLVLDPIDTNILVELSNGSKMGELIKLIPLTKSGIEKRKRRLKSVFKTISDRDLVLAAREKGFI